MLRLLKDEQKLIEFARDEFGESITRFLLAGLGEEGEVRRWVFVVTFTDEGDRELHRSVYVEADDLMPEIPTSLPCRREPLVLLALLRLLMRGRETSPATLFYSPREILDLLGWEDSAETRLAIEEAVGRYSFLSYRWEMSAEELSAEDLTFYRSRERLISGYGHDVESEPGEARADRVTHRVDFSPVFIEGLIDRSLFDISWDRVLSMEIEATD